MSTVTFDTLKYVETLKAAGIPEGQAKAQAEAMKDVLSSEVATKNDLEKTELKLEGRLSRIDWMVGFNLALSVTILFKVFAH